MIKILYTLVCLVLLTGFSLAQSYDVQFIEERNDAVMGGEFDLRIQIRSVESTFNMGTSNLVFEYNTAGLSFDSTLTPHNFSGFIPPLTVYTPMTVAEPFGNAVSVNIVLSLAPGQTVTLTPTWMDVATVDFTIIDPAQTSQCVWRITPPNAITVFDDNSVPIPSNSLNPGDFSLPVELTSFTAGVTPELDVSLQWVTESEINNMGFEVFRSDEEEGTYTLLSSYLSDESLKGYGNSSSKHIYKYTDETVMQDNTYWYKITDVDVNGLREDHGPISIHVVSGSMGEEDPNYIPDEFQLSQNYPNPFNPETKIRVGIPNDQDIGEITINVFNIMGQKVKTLFQGNLEPGMHTIRWDGKDALGKQVSGGTYFYYLKSNKFHQIKKMILMK